ncbi:hypothetical protein [Mesorhizobium loti]|uniref:hypothetical protein n=1 Tax=Rhizobium loti TaxID=381 RepID=UPI00053A6C33|nr:hypothetical protein [Mesorhizobium loti]
MADDMSSNETARQYLDAAHAQLGERVTNLARRQKDLEAEMRSGFRQIEQSFAQFTNETRQSIASLGNAISEKNKPQYQALGFGLSVILAVGALAYWPIRESTSDLKASYIEGARAMQMLAAETNRTIQALTANTVSRQELEWRAQRDAEDRSRTETRISDLRASLVPRDEHERVWENFDRRFADEQRQMDEIKAALAGVHDPLSTGLDLKKPQDSQDHAE